jgi:inhibitor of cysteine peptidase
MGWSVRRSAFLVLGLALTVALVACAAQPAAPVDLTRKDSGSSQTLSVGQELRVTLESNPTTGYRWALDGDVPPQFEQVGEPTYTTTSTALGAGGTEVWTFKVKSAGEATLRLKYARSFEPTATPPETFEVTAKIQ